MRLLFYNDSAIFGGHEIMAARLANCTAQLMAEADGKFEVHFAGREMRFEQLLDTKVFWHHISHHTPTPLPSFRTLLSRMSRRAMGLVKVVSPDVVVICQGDIEMCLAGLFAARCCGIPVVSYLPRAYSFTETRSFLGPARDLLASRIYQVPDAFLTISDAQARRLRGHTDRPITILRNPVICEREIEVWPGFRLKGPLEERCWRLALVGRVVFRQKGHDRTINFCRTLKSGGIGFHLEIIGDGPDLHALQGLARKAGVEHEMTFHGWKPPEWIKQHLATQVDTILIPSRFEGVPLIFLEAIEAGVIPLCWKSEWLDEYMPPDILVINEDAGEHSLNSQLKRLSAADADLLNQWGARALSRHTFEHFYNTVTSWIEELEQLCIQRQSRQTVSVVPAPDGDGRKAGHE